MKGADCHERFPIICGAYILRAAAEPPLMSPSKKQSLSRSKQSDAENALLCEISRLGGEDRSKGAEGALEAFRSALSRLVSENPKAYGADNDTESQKRLVWGLIASVRMSFLKRTISELRYKAGYVVVFGRWIHRAVFTFVGFGLLAAVALPLCAVSLMSTAAWGWVPGAVGIIVSTGVGIWILSRIRNN